jgi:predicted nuclease of restriction endonuclease-like (RecB) superfamily
MSQIQTTGSELLQSIVSLIDSARRKVAVAVNSELTVLYWHIGKQINDRVLKHEKADYGKTVIHELSMELTRRYSQGFSKRNLHNFIRFNELVQEEQIVHSLSAQLTWTHIRNLIYIEDSLKRDFYTQMCIHEHWSVRTLQERVDSMLYERTAISKKPALTITNDLAALKNEKKLTPDLVFHDPYFLDFLGLKDTFSEKDLESSILRNLQNFIVEMGADFAFVGRQKRLVIDNEDYYLDLLFYHRGLRCLVAIDLKLGKFKADYKGQMELYLRWLERNDLREGENPPVGLILCSEKSPEQINYLLLDHPGQIKVAEYMTQLPEKKLLEQKLQQAIELAEQTTKLNNKEK